MTGLRKYERDARLPELAGEPLLVPPVGREVAELVAEHLATPAAAEVCSVRWEFARWKPGSSTTAVHAIELADGTERLVTVKRYVDDKARHLQDKLTDDPRLVDETAPFRPFAVLPDRGLALSLFPGDRELRGLPRLLDVRRTARLLDEAGWCPPRSIRKRRLELELLRYKPERRAVFALLAELRTDPDDRGPRRLAARVLPREAIRAVTHARMLYRRFAESPLGPELLVSDMEAGLLFESWLDVDVLDPVAPESFAQSFRAGELLGRLHAVHHGTPGRVRPAATRSRAALFAFDPELAARGARHVPVRSSASPVWRHGDFHPDQLGRDRTDGRLRLLDLDELCVGDPVDDLVSWIADRLALDPDTSFTDASRYLIEGYRRAGGERVGTVELAAATACALANRAAACLRRLERGARAKARRLLELADEIAADTRNGSVIA